MTQCLLSEIVPILHLHHECHTLMRATAPSPHLQQSRKTLGGYEHAIQRAELGGVRST